MAMVLASAQAGVAQAPLTYAVKQGGREIGREHLTQVGTALRLDASYPSTNTRIEAELDRNEGGSITSFRLRATGGDPGTVAAAGNGARLVVRTEHGGAETAREMPGGRTVVMLDDHAYVLYQAIADLATTSGTPVTAILARSAQRLQLTATRAGDVVTMTGQVRGSIMVASDGRMERLDLPEPQVTVTRQAP
jgi:hypothetical protein